MKFISICIFVSVCHISVAAESTSQSSMAIILSADPSFQETLAAKEIRRYIYLRTGILLPITGPASISDDTIVLVIDKSLRDQQYQLKTVAENNHKVLHIAGGSGVAVLYGAYHFVETLGVRFYLHGDVIPDGKIPFVIPSLDEAHKPIFNLRGLQPFHDFMEGPDWWNVDDYKAYAAQMVKMKMNFLGLHSYPWFKPWKHVPPEPGVWIGLPEDVDTVNGHVKFSYPASWANTARPGPIANNAWGHLPGKTGEFSAGASQIFERDDYGAEVMNGLTPWPKTPEDSNDLFNRVGDMYSDAFGFARRMGVKVCIGSETPYWVPDEVSFKLKEQGRDPDDPAILRELCRGMFTRIMKSHPVDYFWLWTPERPLDPGKTQSDLQMIHDVAKEMDLPIGIAACGWGWLAHQFAAFDKTLPKDICFSCINEKLGFAPVTAEFGKLKNREHWCIPWMEDDTDMIAPQLWVGRVCKDAADAKRLGCTGLMGIHWRTKIIAPNLAMLARCGWKINENAIALRDVIGSSGTVAIRVHRQRSRTADDYYADFCRAEFGPAVASQAAIIFSRMDGQLPRPACWALNGAYGQSAGPGVIGDADRRSWENVVRHEYAFVDEFALGRQKVVGAGNLARFDYWLGQFEYLKAIGKVRCSRWIFEQSVYRAEKAAETEKTATIEAALKARWQLFIDWSDMMTHLLETVSTPGEMGTVANLELHTRLSAGYLTNFDSRLEKLLGKPLPSDQAVPVKYAGKPRLIVPTVRSVANKGESLKLKIIALDKQPVKSVVVNIRALGKGEWQTIPVTHVARAVYEAKLPVVKDDFEYNVIAETAGSEKLIWPATTPEINQTVVVN